MAEFKTPWQMAARYACPVCNAEPGFSCRVLTKYGKWRNVKHHRPRLVARSLKIRANFAFCNVLQVRP